LVWKKHRKADETQQVWRGDGPDEEKKQGGDGKKKVVGIKISCPPSSGRKETPDYKETGLAE